MALGMSYEQYWYGDVRMTKAFWEADKIRHERINSEMWLQGMYIYDAISRLFPIPIALAGKNAQPRDYMERPYEPKNKQSSITSASQEEINKKKAQARGLQAKLFKLP